MILVADAGATKIQWILIQEGKISDPIETSGFNPYFMQPEVLTNSLEKDLVPYINPEYITEVFYYGAGCSTVQKCALVEDVLKDLFSRADFEIHHDLLGAARALLGREDGIACILGTGSNSCLFNGREIVENITSLGYLFGDEGSGACLGKLFLTEYLRRRMPGNIREAFDSKYGYSLENILDSVYNKPFPNRFLSSFSHFIAGFRGDPWVDELVKRNFREFFREQVTQYTGFSSRKLATVGSVGYFYRELFEEVAGEYCLKVSKCIQSPIEGLAAYHSSTGH
jgi:N-acetylglucosamine kinase-like BadF-type ATPase